MKKTFGKLFIIFGVLLCIFAFYGCGEEAETTLQSSDITSAEATKSTSETDETTEKVKETTSAAEFTSEAEETSVETTETEAKTVETSEIEETSVKIEETSSETESLTESVETTEITSEESSETEETEEETTEETWISGTVVAEGSDLIAELVDYLHDLTVYITPGETKNTEKKINEIKDGAQPLLVTYDASSSYYFVCGYFNPTHEWDERYCCREEYVWVKYRNENEIQEYYDGLKIVVAFQVNRAQYVEDIFPRGKATPIMEYFMLYEPEFVDGLNVNVRAEFCDVIIYLNSTDKSTIYYTTDKYNYYNNKLICNLYKNRYCLIVPMGTKYYDERKPDVLVDQESEYGEYYESMMEILIPDEGVAQVGNTLIHFYGLIPIDDFVKEVLK